MKKILVCPCDFCGHVPEFTDEEGCGVFAGLRKVGLECNACGATIKSPGYVPVGREYPARCDVAFRWNIAFGRLGGE